ncbi:dicarboxylate/amino acid:cation symporter [Asticcacaulis sp. ZE23SCel15]|uniref:dicarboxylate/amino acid:cation symporter n=1 Tax=Asticcacaulis sp. ZE23SCel15 TaxID=3059027 RepID=UPI00265EED04|nr:dicarboxylate/amino acid:cation symporter [Asticcacaulis sp. ZE23SCel15]WKL58702.1 dicarboxylate/amino acid:cation symporter [Asticcacaulis sp. ZE23SCel15]
MLSLLNKIPFWLRTVIGLVAGIAVGVIFGERAVPYVEPIGDLFLRLIKMLIVPLVFFTIASSIAKLGHQDGGKAVKLGVQTILWFMITSALAVTLGLGIGHLFQPGLGLTGLPLAELKPKDIPPVVDVFLGIVPTNIIDAFAKGQVLSVVFVAIIVGAALAALRDKTEALSRIVDQGSQVMFQITRWIIRLTPIGVFGLIGSVVGSYGLESLTPLLGFIGAIYLACLIHVFVIYPILLKLHGLRVSGFYKGVFQAQQTAFFTCSSLGTLPVSLNSAINNLKLSPSYAGFAVPLGANMKMDGCGAIYPAIASIFTANYFGIELTTAQIVLIYFSSVLGSLATAGVPGVATVMLTITLVTVGLPIEGLALLAAIDRIIDMVRTATNVTGQILIPTLVARENGLIDKESPLLIRPEVSVIKP